MLGQPHTRRLDAQTVTPLPHQNPSRTVDPPAMRAAEARIIGYTGVTTSQEVRLLIEAFGTIAKEVPQARLLLIGPFENGKYQEGIDPDLRSRIITPGSIPYADLGRYLAAADVLALPLPDVANSRARCPIKFGDYLAAGRPVVSCAHGRSVWWA